MPIIETLQFLEKHGRNMPSPMGEVIAKEYDKNPFVLLVSCLLSLRARDIAVYPVCKNLFSKVTTPGGVLAMDTTQLEALLQPIGFFRSKARILRQVSEALIEKYGSTVPCDLQQLLALPGVGRKTANFMQCYAFDTPAICVDTHVHRLANNFGWVHTHTVEETELELQKLVPQEWWCRLNSILVQWGQQVCKPRLGQKDRDLHNKLCPCLQSNIKQ